MKDINIDLNSIKDLFSKLAKNLTLTFFAVFLILVVFEIFQIKNSVDVVLNVNQPPPVAITQKGVRINFPAYNTVVQRIQAAPDFVPSSQVSADPFSVPAPAAAH